MLGGQRLQLQQQLMYVQCPVAMPNGSRVSVPMLVPTQRLVSPSSTPRPIPSVTDILFQFAYGNAQKKSRGCDGRYFKTVLCRSWSERGRCHYADRCQFAHGSHELRSRPNNPSVIPTTCDADVQHNNSTEEDGKVNGNTPTIVSDGDVTDDDSSVRSDQVSSDSPSSHSSSLALQTSQSYTSSLGQLIDDDDDGSVHLNNNQSWVSDGVLPTTDGGRMGLSLRPTMWTPSYDASQSLSGFNRTNFDFTQLTRSNSYGGWESAWSTKSEVDSACGGRSSDVGSESVDGWNAFRSPIDFSCLATLDRQ